LRDDIESSELKESNVFVLFFHNIVARKGGDDGQGTVMATIAITNTSKSRRCTTTVWSLLVESVRENSSPVTNTRH
jgi:hypothetical protein